MKYEKVDLEKKVKFETIKEGELFKFGDKICMKIEKICGIRAYDDDPYQFNFTAVDMDGGVRAIYDYELVEKVAYNLQIDY